MLYLIGLGLQDEKDISLRAIEVAKNSECFMESYTSKWQGSVESLEKIIGKKVKSLERSDMEENSQWILDLAKERNVAIFVIGDPLSATTHISLILDAKKQGVEYSIVHNASIFTAVAETGLSLYNFGKTATIPFSEQLGNVRNTIGGNKKLSLHTLLLLDIGMKSKDAIEILLRNNLISKSEKILSVHILGQIYYGFPKALLGIEVDEPSILIIPGKLSSVEREFLNRIMVK